jgi:hypothetical protein
VSSVSGNPPDIALFGGALKPILAGLDFHRVRFIGPKFTFIFGIYLEYGPGFLAHSTFPLKTLETLCVPIFPDI